MSERYANGATIRIHSDALVNASGVPQAGLVDVVVKIQRSSDGFFLDFSDNTFKAGGHVAITAAMTELDGTEAPGFYFYDFDSSGFPDDEYFFQITSATAVNDPLAGTAITGGFVDTIRGLLQENALLDNVVNNAGGFMTSGRVRVFASQAALNAATPGAANGAEGEVRRFLVTSVPTVVGGALLSNYKLERDL